MPSITGGLNGASAGRFLDVSGGVGVLFPLPCRTIISGESASVDSQATQPHLEDSTTYHPLRPT